VDYRRRVLFNSVVAFGILQHVGLRHDVVHARHRTQKLHARDFPRRT